MKALYPEIASFVNEAHQLAADNKIDKDIFAPEWDFLQSSEQKLTAVMNETPEPDGAGEAEYGMVLYWVHEVLPDILAKLRLFNIPATTIAPAVYNGWLTKILTGGGIVTASGAMISTTKFASLDVGYASTVLYYLRTRTKIPVWSITPHPFMSNPANLPINASGPLKIAIFGDWGTGQWTDGTLANNPAELVSQAVRSLSPDIVIHLGDVYYCGTSAEEQSHFNDVLPPGGSYTFTLNSNHEMYDGALGYFGTALANPYLKAQNGTSYFSFTVGNYVFFGLDSAYYDPTPLYKNGALGGTQVKFVQDIMATLPAGRQIVLLTHHNPISYDGKKCATYNTSGGSLASDVYEALGNRWPDYWYYGHLHNGIVYNGPNLKASGVLKPDAEGLLNLRCMGHGGIPFGKAQLNGNTLVDYSAQTAVGAGGPTLANRVLNGFTLLTVSDAGVQEDVYEVQNPSAANKNIMNRMWNMFWPKP